MNNELLKPAIWTAWRSYLSSSGEARTIIANEKNHQKIFLDDESSLLWACIEKGASYKSLKARAVELNVENDLDSFIGELDSLGLLFKNSSDLSDARNVEPVPTPKSIEEANNSEPERLFQNWVMDQGFMYHTIGN
jgi:hypothetical protein